MIRNVIAISVLCVIMGCSNGSPKFTEVMAEGESIRLEAGNLEDGNVHFFTFRGSSKMIDFFVRIDGTGTLHVYFNACYTCYQYKKGYKHEGTVIICNECGKKFSLAEEEWHDDEGCQPVEIPHARDGNMIAIKVSDIIRGEKLF